MKLLVIELCEKNTLFNNKKKIYNVNKIKNQTNLDQTLKILRSAN